MNKRKREGIIIAIFTNSILIFLALGLGLCDFLLIVPAMRKELNHPIVANICLLLSIACLLMFLWCWIYAGTMDPGSVKADLKKRGIYKQIKQGIIPPCLQHLPICSVCLLPKPPGAVHCVECGSCFLRCDHHCAVIGQCVADKNFKAFVLALFWGGIYGISIALTSIIRITFKTDIISMLIGLYCLGIGIGLMFFAFSFIVDDPPPVRIINATRGNTFSMGEHIRFMWGTFGKNFFERIIPLQKDVTPLAWGGIEWYENTLL